MSIHIVFKNSDGAISICTPADQESLLRQTKNLGRKEYVGRHEAARQYHIDNELPTHVHDKRLSWAQGADFENLSDADFKAIIETDIPHDVQYTHWVDIDTPFDLEFFGAWSDIDAKAVVTYDYEKARQIALERARAQRNALLNKYDALQSRANDLADEAVLMDVKAKKQALRDAPAHLVSVSISSIADIRAAVPDLSKF
ncbi:MAG: hypothetical protein ABIP54_02255 [Candidatus Andersenbacteria bacterium]